MSSGSVSAAPPPAEPAPVPPPSPEPAAPARTVEPYRPKSTGAAMLDAIEADILNLETTLEAAPAADEGFAAFETAPAADADEGLISLPAANDYGDAFAAYVGQTKELQDLMGQSFEAAPAAAAGADAPDGTATAPVEPTPAPRETAQKTSPFEAAIAARRARSEAQKERSDPLAEARATTVI